MESNLSTCVPRVDRWLGLSSNMIIMACGGLTYTYAVYSGHLKNVLHYTQEQTDDVGAAKDFGSVLGLLSGFFYNFYPPWITICIGAFLHLFGYSMVWMTLIGAVSPSFWLLCMYFTLGVGGDAYIDTGCIITTLESFGDHRGTAMGVLKAQVGLSGAMFVLIYEVFIEPDVDQFILLVALAPSIAGFALAFLTRPFPPENQDEDDEDIRQRFRLTYGVLITLGIFLMVVITIRAFFHSGRPVLAFFLTIMIVLASIMFTLPLIRRPVDFISSYIGWDDTDDVDEGIRLKEYSRRRSRYKKKPFRPELEDIHEGEESAGLKSSSDVESDDDIVVFGGGKPETFSTEKPPEPSLLSSLLGIDFWLITIVVMVGGGTGLAIINNFAQIGQALGDGQVDVYVGLISVWSCFGRLLGGYGSDYLLKRGYPRPLCLLLAQLLMSSCCLLLSTGWVPFLYVGSCMVGMAYGSHWSIQPPILAEVFGLQHFASLYKINSCAAPIGAYLLSTKVVGVLYDKEAAVYRSQALTHVAENTCLGTQCFGPSLLVLAFLCFLSAIMTFWFMVRTRPFYTQQQPSSPNRLHSVQVD
ncbi:hypothetical protein KC19_6G200300 [Ceratodon purpureus]|uniref:Nodulin-like domain-containing protein n=1 Tax=Ceratodon purpureus TaxID=3225 RepID=A0A8T0HJH6_CERPU|nr:hypothetical protein KC19_6G200300 [Ceratodon purpureus]